MNRHHHPEGHHLEGHHLDGNHLEGHHLEGHHLEGHHLDGHHHLNGLDLTLSSMRVLMTHLVLLRGKELKKAELIL